MLTRSRALDFLRSSYARFSLQSESMDEAHGIQDSTPDPERSVAQAGLGEAVQRGLALLPPEQLQPIELAYFNGLTQAEIASRLSWPLGTVKTRIRLGMLRLRDTLEPYREGVL